MLPFTISHDSYKSFVTDQLRSHYTGEVHPYGLHKHYKLILPDKLLLSTADRNPAFSKIINRRSFNCI